MYTHWLIILDETKHIMNVLYFSQPTDDYSFTVNMPGSWPAVDAQKDHVSFAAGTAKRK